MFRISTCMSTFPRYFPSLAACMNGSTSFVINVLRGTGSLAMLINRKLSTTPFLLSVYEESKQDNAQIILSDRIQGAVFLKESRRLYGRNHCLFLPRFEHKVAKVSFFSTMAVHSSQASLITSFRSLKVEQKSKQLIRNQSSQDFKNTTLKDNTYSLP